MAATREKATPTLTPYQARKIALEEAKAAREGVKPPTVKKINGRDMQWDGSGWTPVTPTPNAARDPTEAGIEAGIQNLRGIAANIDDPSFDNALGPLQGSTPDGYFTAPFINAARFGGEVANYFEGGEASFGRVCRALGPACP